MLHLITGGARSGKSRHAETLALAHAGPVHYLATARVGDAEFAERVAHHRARRPAGWGLTECGTALAAALQAVARPDGLVLVDCLTLWLAGFLREDDGIDAAAFARERGALLVVLAGLPGEAVLVSNEIGLGVVPLGRSTRWFVDELGRLNQDVAALAGRVTLVSCGLPLCLKGGGQ